MDLNAAAGVPNASMPLPWLVVSGQPSEQQLATLSASGLATVIDIRDPMEPRGFDEPEAATKLGLRYVNIPVISGAVDDATMDRLVATMRDARGTPTLLHCSSANRTGGPLIAHLVLTEKLAEPAAVDAALRSGLRSAELMQWASDYIKRHQ